MPALPFAIAADVAARWRPLTPDEQSVATVLVADASGMIRDRWPDIDARIASGTPAASSVTRIVAMMVKRAMLNADTDGLESRQQAAGPFSVNDKFSNPDGSLYFRADELAVLEGDGYRHRAVTAWLA